METPLAMVPRKRSGQPLHDSTATKKEKTAQTSQLASDVKALDWLFSSTGDHNDDGDIDADGEGDGSSADSAVDDLVGEVDATGGLDLGVGIQISENIIKTATPFLIVRPHWVSCRLLDADVLIVSFCLI